MDILDALDYVKAHPAAKVDDQSDHRFASSTDKRYVVREDDGSFSLVRAACQWGVGQDSSGKTQISVDRALDLLADAVYRHRCTSEKRALALLF